MKGVILAGGKGTRLYPCTLVVNKHLLPLYNKPMIYYPIQTLKQVGCQDILIITGGENAGDFMRLLKNGQELGLNSLLYAYQENPTGGIGDALKLAKSFVGDDKFCVILGDNLIFDDLSEAVTQYLTDAQPGSAKVFLKEVSNPEAFGVAEIQNNQIIRLVEKPSQPVSNLAVIGFYLYDREVFNILDTLNPSHRGELEITDVNKVYLTRKSLSYYKMTNQHEWLDTGSFLSLYQANCILAQLSRNI